MLADDEIFFGRRFMPSEQEREKGCIKETVSETAEGSF